MKLLPCLTFLLGSLFPCAPGWGQAVAATRAPALDTAALATLAVQDHGRKKPFTTFAQETLLTLSGGSSLPVGPPEAPHRLAAETVLLDLWLAPENWDQQPLIFIQLRELKRRLGLPEDEKLFRYRDLAGRNELLALVKEAQAQRAAGREEALTPLQKEAEHLGERLQLFVDCVNGVNEKIVPHPSRAEDAWLPFGDLATSRNYDANSAAVQQAIEAFTAWQVAYAAAQADGNAPSLLDDFNRATPALVAALRALSPTVYPAAAALQFEHRFMVFQPFRWAWIAYLIAFLVLVLTSTWGRAWGYRLTWFGVITGLALAVYGFACRAIISGRPPVTNMYETVIWVSFIALALAVGLEAIYRKRYYFYAGLPAAIFTLMIADTQPTVLDASIHPLTAVLRSNLWLMIHVLTIVSSYAAFALAAALGHIALGIALRGRRYALAGAEVQLFIYRAIQVGVLLLAAGTILGGVWANYSWGRFWGWDPKETWALITLLCYLALLHGRLAGFWGGFGLAVGSIVCFLSVVMSWYGVNYVLGKGLHSYGFGSGGFGAVAIFAGAEVLFVIGLLIGVYRVRARDVGPTEAGAQSGWQNRTGSPTLAK